ncbi:unnamed protein product, partial [Durusdinium trenchii]
EAEAGGQVTGSAEVLEEEDEVDSPGGAVDSRETSHERPQRRAFGRNTDRNALKKEVREKTGNPSGERELQHIADKEERHLTWNLLKIARLFGLDSTADGLSDLADDDDATDSAAVAAPHEMSPASTSRATTKPAPVSPSSAPVSKSIPVRPTPSARTEEVPTRATRSFWHFLPGARYHDTVNTNLHRTLANSKNFMTKGEEEGPQTSGTYAADV